MTTNQVSEEVLAVESLCDVTKGLSMRDLISINMPFKVVSWNTYSTSTLKTSKGV